MSHPVQFDFEGSLQVARMLWALADDVEETRNKRLALAKSARSTWKGRYAVQFDNRIHGEERDLLYSTARLREGAQQWAQAYAKAVNEQNNYLYAQEKNRVRAELEQRAWYEELGHKIFGNEPGMPRDPSCDPCPVPSPPHFAATNSPRLYW